MRLRLGMLAALAVAALALPAAAREAGAAEFVVADSRGNMPNLLLEVSRSMEFVLTYQPSLEP